jgi:hypothetical protein
MKPRAVNGCPGRRCEAANLSSHDHVHHRIVMMLALHANRSIRHQAPTGGSDQSHSMRPAFIGSTERCTSLVRATPTVGNSPAPKV